MQLVRNANKDVKKATFGIQSARLLGCGTQ